MGYSNNLGNTKVRVTFTTRKPPSSSPILWKILKLEIMEYLIHYMLIWNVDSLALCKLPTLLLTVKLRLGHKFSQCIHRFKIGIFWVLVLGCTSKFFPINQEIFEFLNVGLAGLLNFFWFKKKMKSYKCKLENTAVSNFFVFNKINLRSCLILACSVD